MYVGWTHHGFVRHADSENTIEVCPGCVRCRGCAGPGLGGRGVLRYVGWTYLNFARQADCHSTIEVCPGCVRCRGCTGLGFGVCVGGGVLLFVGWTHHGFARQANSESTLEVSPRCMGCLYRGPGCCVCGLGLPRLCTTFNRLCKRNGCTLRTCAGPGGKGGGTLRAGSCGLPCSACLQMSHHSISAQHRLTAQLS
jgi:hypothetical protein